MPPHVSWVVTRQATEYPQVLLGGESLFEVGGHNGAGPGGVSQDPLLKRFDLVRRPLLLFLFVVPIYKRLKRMFGEQVPKVDKAAFPDLLHQRGG